MLNCLYFYIFIWSIKKFFWVRLKRFSWLLFDFLTTERFYLDLFRFLFLLRFLLFWMIFIVRIKIVKTFSWAWWRTLFLDRFLCNFLRWFLWFFFLLLLLSRFLFCRTLILWRLYILSFCLFGIFWRAMKQIL